MGDSKVLKNHRAKYALRSDRNYVAFEEGVIRSDLGAAFMMLSDACPFGELRLLCTEIGREFDLEKQKDFDAKSLDELREAARRMAWRYMNTDQAPWADFLLMFLSFISSGNRLESKEQPREEMENDGA